RRPLAGDLLDLRERQHAREEPQHQGAARPSPRPHPFLLSRANPAVRSVSSRAGRAESAAGSYTVRDNVNTKRMDQVQLAPVEAGLLSKLSWPLRVINL